MTSYINWGREIPVNGARPVWLENGVPIVRHYNHTDGRRLTYSGTTNLDIVAWRDHTAICLPADHFAYNALGAGFEPFLCDGSVPDDWDGGVVLLANGFKCAPSHWRKEPGAEDIVGYRKRANGKFSPGDRVQHDHYGPGSVVSDTTHLVVDFDVYCGLSSGSITFTGFCRDEVSALPAAAQEIAEPTAEWWAKRWLKGASDGEKAAMRRLLA
jgi:hypothetical protein